MLCLQQFRLVRLLEPCARAGLFTVHQGHDQGRNVRAAQDAFRDRTQKCVAHAAFVGSHNNEVALSRLGGLKNLLGGIGLADGGGLDLRPDFLVLLALRGPKPVLTFFNCFAAFSMRRSTI